jgi:hypothetical protein
MIRVVLDTNILISAVLNPKGLPRQVFLMAITQPDTRLCVSGDIYAEYDEVIRRPRLSRTREEIAATLGAFVRMACGLYLPRRYAPVLTRMTTFFWNVRRQQLRTTS